MTTAAQVKQVLASLKSSQATLKIYAEKARHEESKAAFREAADTLSGIIDGLGDRIGYMESEEPQFKGL